jgi:hypothetical protein
MEEYIRKLIKYLTGHNKAFDIIEVPTQSGYDYFILAVEKNLSKMGRNNGLKDHVGMVGSNLLNITSGGFAGGGVPDVVGGIGDGHGALNNQAANLQNQVNQSFVEVAVDQAHGDKKAQHRILARARAHRGFGMFSTRRGAGNTISIYFVLGPPDRGAWYTETLRQGNLSGILNFHGCSQKVNFIPNAKLIKEDFHHLKPKVSKWSVFKSMI